MHTVIELNQLSKSYGKRRGLAGLSLEVNAGEVFGYLGPNGAGKSTTIRLLLDLIRPTSGSARLLGLDPRADAVELHRRIGYLAGDFVVDGRQRVGECLTFLGALRGGVAPARVTELAERLDLDLEARIKSLSKGNRQKVGLGRHSCTARSCSSSTNPPPASTPWCNRPSWTWCGKRATPGRPSSCRATS